MSKLKFKTSFRRIVASFAQLIGSRTHRLVGTRWLTLFALAPTQKGQGAGRLRASSRPIRQQSDTVRGAFFCVLAAMENQDPEYKPTEKQLRSVPQPPVRPQPNSPDDGQRFSISYSTHKVISAKNYKYFHEALNFSGTLNK